MANLWALIKGVPAAIKLVDRIITLFEGWVKSYREAQLQKQVDGGMKDIDEKLDQRKLEDLFKGKTK